MYMGSYNPLFPTTLTGLTGWYTGDSVVGSPMTEWTDVSGNGRHVKVNGNDGANISGSILTSSTDGGLIGGPRPFIYGGTTDKIRFPTTVLASGNNDYTLFHVSRYYSIGPTTTRQRIWDGVGGNWLSGFHSGESGVAHHGGWTTTNTSVDVHGDNWVFSTDQRYLYRSNGVTRGYGIGGGTSEQLSINWGVYSSSQPSTFGVAEVIVYNRWLSSTEYTNVENYLNFKYTATLDLQSIGIDAVDSPPFSLSEYYNEPFQDGTSAPSSGEISIFSFIGPFIGILNPKALGAPPAAAGQQEFLTPGNYNFTVPTGVTSLSCVVIGGGGGSSGCNGSSRYSGAGGGGGGLAYGTFSVTAGSTVTVYVGGPGTAGTNVNSSINRGGGGGESSILYGGNVLLRAIGGSGGRYGTTSSASGGGYSVTTPTVTSGGGGNGGYGGGARYNNGGGGGGGAGGYGGNGGNGGIGNSGSGTSGNNGGGGGGGGRSYGGTPNNGGGGTGLNGRGANGAGGYRNNNGKGGSGGGNGGSATGGQRGGGGGGCEDDTNRPGYIGGSGGARIIWGTGRAYPATNTADV